MSWRVIFRWRLISGGEWYRFRLCDRFFRVQSGGLTVIIQLEALTIYSGEVIFRMDLALVIPSGPPHRAKTGKGPRKKGKKNCHLPGSNKRPHEFEQMTSVVRSPNWAKVTGI
jgi:hypothetical protein